MNSQPIKLLSDYSDGELTEEITKRINNYSLDITCLLIPLAGVGMQHYRWYQEKNEQTTFLNSPKKRFKYNYRTNQLWKLNKEHDCEVSEQNHFRHLHSKYGKEAWKLANNHWLFINLSTTSLEVIYQENELIYYQILALSPNGEIIFEFTKADRQE